MALNFTCVNVGQERRFDRHLKLFMRLALELRTQNECIAI